MSWSSEEGEPKKQLDGVYTQPNPGRSEAACDHMSAGRVGAVPQATFLKTPHLSSGSIFTKQLPYHSLVSLILRYNTDGNFMVAEWIISQC